MTVITNSPEETISFGEKIGKLLRGGDIIAFSGDLGAGKTTMTRGIAVGMGLPDEVTSPTFAIVNEYRGKLDMYHFDMYRIIDEDSVESTGYYDYPQGDSVFVIEWSENVSGILPADTIEINILRVDDNVRKITVNGDERFADSRN